MKQLILKSELGRITLNAKEKFILLKTALMSPESVGTIANDYLAFLLITRMCPKENIFIDIGAHIGSIISEVHATDKNIKILAFEAIPEKVKKIQKFFPYAKTYNYALGETEGDVSFFINTKQTGYSSLIQPISNENIEKITVPLKKLDNIVTSNKVDSIKIDVEGAELGVIRGATKLLSDSRPIIMFESAPPINKEHDKENLWDELTNNGYQIFIPNRLAHDGDGLSLGGFTDSHIYPRRTTNYFAVPDERRIEYRDRARRILKI